MENLVPASILATYAALLVIDVVAPARAFPRLRAWRLKGIGFFVLYFAISSSLPIVWDAWFAEHQLLDGSGLGIVGGAVVGLLVLQLGVYLWHRALHRVPLLWRWFHQMHHSAERVDVPGAFVFHPLDMAGWTLVGSVCLVLVIGLRVEAAVIASVIAGVAAVFQHSNLRTPRWLGYVVHRPESHSVHHERGVHAYNYGDIPIWDIVFRTFVNPNTWEGQAGFYDGASDRVGDMLVGRDVSEPAPRKRREPALHWG